MILFLLPLRPFHSSSPSSPYFHPLHHSHSLRQSTQRRHLLVLPIQSILLDVLHIPIPDYHPSGNGESGLVIRREAEEKEGVDLWIGSSELDEKQRLGRVV